MLRTRLYNSIKKLDVLQELIEDDEITEIMVNGYDNIFIERNGCITRCERQFESEEKLADVAQRIAAMSNKIINESSPIVDTRLPDRVKSQYGITANSDRWPDNNYKKIL